MILVDTGLIYAAYDRDDNYHYAASAWFASADDVLAVTTPIIVESAWQLEDAKGPTTEAGFLRSVREGRLLRVDLSDNDWVRVEQLIEQYADLELGTADASIVAIAERLGIDTIATFNDRDFRVVRPRHVEAFHLVPRDE